MPNFSALDADGGIFGDITFSIVDTVENSGEADFFEVVSIGAKSAQLYLRKPIEAKFYHVRPETEYIAAVRKTMIYVSAFRSMFVPRMAVDEPRTGPPM